MREKMVREQVQNRGISSPDVIRAMLEVPRDRFVPREMQRFAYEDGPVTIGYDLFSPQPYIVAYMTELLELYREDKVLEIGTGLGYHTAILAMIVDEVYSIEALRPLGERAQRTLHDLRFDNASVKIGDGYNGWKEKGPFDCILMTTAPAREIPPPLLDQLKDGGRVVAPIGEHRQKLVLLDKVGDRLEKRVLLSVRFDSMFDPTSQKRGGGFRNDRGPSRPNWY